MTVKCSILLVLAAVAVCGCTKTTTTLGGAAGSQRDLERLRETYAQKDPKVVVGSVVGVLPEESLLAVGNVPVDRFFTGDPLSILDADETTIAFATVVRRSLDTVHVKYTSQPTARAPVEGDLVVRFPR